MNLNKLVAKTLKYNLQQKIFYNLKCLNHKNKTLFEGKSSNINLKLRSNAVGTN